MKMPQDKNRKVFQIAFHALAWGLIFASPFFFAYGNNTPFSPVRYLDFCIVPLTFMAVFYINYFVLIDRVLFRKHMGRFVAFNLLLIVALNLTEHLWHDIFRLHFLPEGPRGDRGGRPPFYFFLLWKSVQLALVVGLSVAIKMTSNWFRTEAEKREIEKARAQAELENLKSQLNPHFLFNTLNNIYALIGVNPSQARYAVHSLSHMLRYVLYDNNQNLIPLDKEFAFMKNYVELMSLRLTERVEMNVDIPDDGQGYMVAPLLFITLVENAFKHGVSPTEASFVRISMRIVRDSTVACTIENSYFPATDGDRSGSGIGLNNLRKRLDLIYPNRHILRTERIGDKFMSQLIINL